MQLPYAGWIWFNEEGARCFLEQNGFVYTVRRVRSRKQGWGYARKGREFLFKVHIVMAAPDLSTLSEFVGTSGFSSVEEWQKAIKRQHSTPQSGLAVFKATRISASS